MSTTTASLALAALKKNAQNIANTQTLVGLDGFVDTIIHVVATRESATKFKRLHQMADFGAKISAAAGLSANFEFITEAIKLGGNGPIMANALAAQGQKITYLGNLGFPNIHPVFHDFTKNAHVISLAEPGYTDAIEFDDGKLMCGKHEGLKDVNWNNILKHVPEEDFIQLFEQSALIALVNWTMLTSMSAIFKKILTVVAPKLTGPKRWIFFDLADPAKRTREDLQEALTLIGKFQKTFKVILGLNLQEARQVGQLYGIPPCSDTQEAVATQAVALQKALGLETVVVHPTHFAAAADATSSAVVAGPFTAKPKITTGAGDHFNAGFCLGRLLDDDLAVSLQLGVATSGYYVRNAKSPSLNELKKFLGTL